MEFTHVSEADIEKALGFADDAKARGDTMPKDAYEALYSASSDIYSGRSLPATLGEEALCREIFQYSKFGLSD